MRFDEGVVGLRAALLVLLSMALTAMLATWAGPKANTAEIRVQTQAQTPFDPESLVREERWGGRSRAIAVSGTVAALGVGRRVALHDVQAQHDLRLRDHSPVLGGEVTDLAWHDSAIYVATGEAGLAVLQMRDGQPLAEIAQPATESVGPAIGLTVDAERRELWVSSGSEGVTVMDLEAPLRPRPKFRLDQPELARRVVLRDHFGLIITGIHGAYPFRRDGPEAPTVLPNFGPDIYDAVIGEQHFYIATGDDGLWTLRRGPDEVGPTRIWEATFRGRTVGIRRFGDRIYALPGSRSELAVYDIDEAGIPVPSRVVEGGSDATDIAITGERMLLSERSGGLRTYHRTPGGTWLPLRNLLLPPRIVSITSTPDSWILSAGPAGVFGIHRSPAPSDPVAWHVPAAAYSREATVAGEHAYVADDRGLQVIDLGADAGPLVTHVVAPERPIQAVAGWGDDLLVSAQERWHRFDLADPARPVDLGPLPLPEHGRWAAVIDDVLVAQISPIEIGVFDVRPPLALTLRARWVPGPSHERGVAIGWLGMLDATRFATLVSRPLPDGNDSHHLEIVEVIGDVPSRIGSLDLPRSALRMDLQMPWALVASETRLHAIDLRLPHLPDERKSWPLDVDDVGPFAHRSGASVVIAAGGELLWLAPELPTLHLPLTLSRR